MPHTTVVVALLVLGGVLCDALLVSVGGGAPSAWIEPSATMHAGGSLLAKPAPARCTISAQLQSAPPPEGFEWGYDSSAAATDAGGADAGGSPEELLLQAIEALREQELERAL